MRTAKLMAFCLAMLSVGCSSWDASHAAHVTRLPEDDQFSAALGYYAKGLLLEANEGRTSGASLDAFVNAHHADSDSAPPLGRAVMGFLEAGRIDDALPLLAAHVKRQPHNPEAWIALGHVAELAAKHRVAADAFARATVLHDGSGTDNETVIAEIRNWFLAKDDAKAVRRLRHLVNSAAIDDDDANQTPLKWARYFILTKKAPARALPIIKILIDGADTPNKKAAAETFYGDALLRAGSTNRAIRTYWQALQTAPIHIPAARRIAANFFSRSDTNGVLRLSNRVAAAKDPLGTALVASLAWMFLQQPERATDVLLLGHASARARNTVPPADYYLMLGARLDDSERNELATELFLEALVTHTNAHPIMNHLAYMWAVNNTRLCEAEQWAERALTHDPRNYAYIDTLGWVYYHQGKLSQALTQLLLAARLAPKNDSVIFDHVGDALHALRRPEEAIAFWRQALSVEPDIAGVAHKIEEAIAAIKASKEDSKEDGS